MKIKYFITLSILLWVISLFMILYWYDWKLLVILTVSGWANNLMKTINSKNFKP